MDNKTAENAKKSQAAIVLLNWNGKDWLSRFLPNLTRFSAAYTIVLADNDSTDESIAYVEAFYPQIKIIKNQTNGGFAKGYNDALKELEGQFDFYALVNTDIEVTEHWLDHLILKLEENSTIGGVQPKIRSFYQRDSFEHAGASGGFVDRSFYPFCRGRIFDAVEKDVGQYGSVREIFWTTGACFVIRAQLFHSLGGFDESFFAHMEEIDLCWRAQQLGYTFYVVPSSLVYHVGGGTLAYDNPRKTFLNFRNSLMMIHKNYNGFLFGMILKRLLLDGVAGIKFLLTGKWKHISAILKAHFSYYKHWSYLNQEREKIKQNRTTNELTGVYKGSILYAHFIKRLKTFSSLNQRRFTE